MTTIPAVARRSCWAALVLAGLFGGCKGNVNDDTVVVFPIELVSRGTTGEAGTNDSSSPYTSADGRYIAFQSYSPNLHPLDTNNSPDIFVRDTVAGTTELVSVNSTWSGPGNSRSILPCISPDGQFVAFLSSAKDLIPTGIGFTYNTSYSYDYDVYVRDLWLDTTLIVSVNGAETGTGTWGVNQSSPTVVTDSTYVYVCFSTGDQTMVTPTNGYYQIFVRRIPRTSFAVTNVTLATIQSGDTIMVSTDNYTDPVTDNLYGNGYSYNPVMALDAAAEMLYVAWDSSASDLLGDPSTTDTNNEQDVFLRPIDTSATANWTTSPSPALGTTALVSVRDSGVQGGDGPSESPSISADGEYVAFQSEAKDLLPAGDDTNGKMDIYMRGPLIAGGAATERISESSLGEANEESTMPFVAGGGQYVVFTSRASNLIEGDSNGAPDVFLKDTASDTIVRVSITVFGSETYGGSGSSWDGLGSVVTEDGRTVIFSSEAVNILPGVTIFDRQQVYRRRF